jgi:uncharacterized protein (DUF1778 family)
MNTTKRRLPPERLQVVSGKISREERKLLEAAAAIMHMTLSGAVRQLVRDGARERLQEMGAEATR